jgi:hypothetical protein
MFDLNHKLCAEFIICGSHYDPIGFSGYTIFKEIALLPSGTSICVKILELAGLNFFKDLMMFCTSLSDNGSFYYP